MYFIVFKSQARKALANDIKCPPPKCATALAPPGSSRRPVGNYRTVGLRTESIYELDKHSTAHVRLGLGKMQPSERRNAVGCFFVSYAGHDHVWAEWIAWQLEAEGYSTVLQAWDFAAGSNWVLEMKKAAARCDRTIAVLSPNYLASQFGQVEWAAAFAQDPTGEKRTLIPVRIAEVDLTAMDRVIAYVDMVGLSVDMARARILEAVSTARKKPIQSPVFPGTATTMTVPQQPRPSSELGLPAEFPGDTSHAPPLVLVQIVCPPVLVGGSVGTLTVGFHVADHRQRLTLELDRSDFRIGDPEPAGLEIFSVASGRYSLEVPAAGEYAVKFPIAAAKIENGVRDLRIVVRDESGRLLTARTYLIAINPADSWVNLVWYLFQWRKRQFPWMVAAVAILWLVYQFLFGSHAVTLQNLFRGRPPEDYLAAEGEGFTATFDAEEMQNAARWITMGGARIDKLSKDLLQVRAIRQAALTQDPVETVVTRLSGQGALFLRGGAIAYPSLVPAKNTSPMAREDVLAEFEAQVILQLSRSTSAGLLLHSRQARAGGPWQGYYFRLTARDASRARWILTGESCTDVLAKQCIPLESPWLISDVPKNADPVSLTMGAERSNESGRPGWKLEIRPIFGIDGQPGGAPGTRTFHDSTDRFPFGGFAIVGPDGISDFTVEYVRILKGGLLRPVTQ
jgi:hypothetical protein